MSQVNTQQCDGCKVLKQESNHWFAIYIGNLGVSLTISSDPEDQKSDAWNHYCGPACVTKALNEWLEQSRKKSGL